MATAQQKDKPFVVNKERMLKDAKEIMDNPEIVAALKKVEERFK